MNNEDNFKQRIQRKLASRSVDAQTSEALRAARNTALDALPGVTGMRWIPATAVSVLVIALAVGWLLRGIDEIALPQMAADDLAVIASDDELEFFEELEFYAWFEQDHKV